MKLKLMELKVGDKVKITKRFFDQSKVKEEFEIIEVRSKRVPLRYVIKQINNRYCSCPVYEYEIEKVNMVGQQLFSFMMP